MISGSHMRWMELLVQGSNVEVVVCRMASVLFTFAGFSPTHHCTEGVGIPWKEQLHMSVLFSKQE